MNAEQLTEASLTKLEKHVWAECAIKGKSFYNVAVELNRSEATISSAYNRADQKVAIARARGGAK